MVLQAWDVRIISSEVIQVWTMLFYMEYKLCDSATVRNLQENLLL
jgi:hypothetical protein